MIQHSWQHLVISGREMLFGINTRLIHALLINVKTIYANGEVNESFYTISGGNAIKEVYKVNNVIDDVTDYEYETSFTSKLHYNMASSSGIKNLYGKGYTNELKAFKRYDGAGVLEFQKISTFTLDADGYVYRRKDFYPISNQTSEYEFTYQ